MYKLIIIFMFICSNIFGQVELNQTDKRKLKMDSMAISHFKINKSKSQNSLTSILTNSKILVPSLGSFPNLVRNEDNRSDLNHRYTSGNWIPSFKLDFRLKFYISDNIRIIIRHLYASRGRNYSELGLILKM